MNDDFNFTESPDPAILMTVCNVFDQKELVLPWKLKEGCNFHQAAQLIRQLFADFFELGEDDHLSFRFEEPEEAEARAKQTQEAFYMMIEAGQKNLESFRAQAQKQAEAEDSDDTNDNSLPSAQLIDPNPTSPKEVPNAQENTRQARPRSRKKASDR